MPNQPLKHLILMFFLSILVACTESKINIGFLNSSNLSTLKLTAPSPFDSVQQTNRDSYGYIYFTGSCHTKFSQFEMSFIGDTWYTIPAIPDVACPSLTAPGCTKVETTPTNLVYDLDCTDGIFSFWVYMHQIDANFPTLQNNSGPPPQIMLRGKVSGILANPLVIPNINQAPPVAFKISRPRSPDNTVGLNQCFEIDVTLVDQNGNPSWFPTNTPFTLIQNSSGTSSAPPTLYTTWQDCNNNSTTNTLSPVNIIIPAYQSTARLITKYNSPTYTSGSLTELSLSQNIFTSASSMVFTLITTTLISPPPTSPHPDFAWISVEAPYAMVKNNVCYPANISIKDYLGNFVAATLAIQLSAPLDIGMYSDSSCTLAIGTTISITNSYQLYLKINALSILNQFKLKASYVSSSVGTIFDSSTQTVSIDTTGSAIPRALQFDGDNLMTGFSTANICHVSYYHFGLVNENQTPLPISTTNSITLSTVATTGGGSGAFYSATTQLTPAPLCSGTALTLTSVAIGSVSNSVQFVPTAVGSYTLTATVSGVTLTTPSVSKTLVVTP